MATLEYRIKCSNCGLHYVVLSWSEVHEQWATEHKGGFCPECGIPGAKFVWGPVETERQIFEAVPGIIGVEEINDQKVGVPPPMEIFAGPPAGLYGVGAQKRGPYGTNEGDIWDAPGSDVQNVADAKGKGEVLIHQVIDGEEKIYFTTDPEIIEQAKAGGKRYAAARAAHIVKGD